MNYLVSALASRSRKWPKYARGRHPDFIHALGVLADNFNALESALRHLFQRYVTLPRSATEYVFMKLNNAERLEVLTACCEASKHSKRVKSGLRYFVKGFERCAQNRNILMHARTYALFDLQSQKRKTIFHKASRKFPYFDSTYDADISSIAINR